MKGNFEMIDNTIDDDETISCGGEGAILAGRNS